MWCDQSHVRRCRRNQKKEKETNFCWCLKLRHARGSPLAQLCDEGYIVQSWLRGSSQKEVVSVVSSLFCFSLHPSSHPPHSFMSRTESQTQQEANERKKKTWTNAPLCERRYFIPLEARALGKNIQHATLAFTPQVSKLSARCSRVSQWSTVKQSKPSCSHSVPRISFIFFVEWETLFSVCVSCVLFVLWTLLRPWAEITVTFFSRIHYFFSVSFTYFEWISCVDSIQHHLSWVENPSTNDKVQC